MGLPLQELSTGTLSSRSIREAGVFSRAAAWLSPAPPPKLLVYELTCASPIVPSRTHPPAPGNAAAPERLEALKYQRIKKPKKSSKGSSKSKKRSGKCGAARHPSLPTPTCLYRSQLWVLCKVSSSSVSSSLLLSSANCKVIYK